MHSNTADVKADIDWYLVLLAVIEYSLQIFKVNGTVYMIISN